jgi:hypothetical protein
MFAIELFTVKRFVVAAMLTAGIAQATSAARAASFSSTSILNQTFTRQLSYNSRFTNSEVGVNSSQSTSTNLSSGVNSASVTADTATDTGQISGFAFKPFSLPASTRVRNVNVQRLIVDVPADFPNPAITHIETDVYHERFNITGLAPATAALESSDTGAILPQISTPPWFIMNAGVTLSSLSFVVQGTYEVTGPTESFSVPFSVEFQPTNGETLAQRTRIEGGPSFNNGFKFILGNDLTFNYRAVNPVVFDDDVDDLHVRAGFVDTNYVVQLLRGAPVPEPRAISVAILAAISLVATRRRGRSSA